MLPLSDLQRGLAVVGLEPNVVATVQAVAPIGNEGAFQIFYTLPDGTLKERLLNPDDEAGLELAVAERPWSFDGDGAAFQLTCEARRIDLAFLFDPVMAGHTSNVEPLPHQITTVYESMLPRQPLRYVLADDAGVDMPANGQSKLMIPSLRSLRRKDPGRPAVWAGSNSGR